MANQYLKTGWIKLIAPNGDEYYGYTEEEMMTEHNERMRKQEEARVREQERQERLKDEGEALAFSYIEERVELFREAEHDYDYFMQVADLLEIASYDYHEGMVHVLLAALSGADPKDFVEKMGDSLHHWWKKVDHGAHY